MDVGSLHSQLWMMVFGSFERWAYTGHGSRSRGGNRRRAICWKAQNGTLAYDFVVETTALCGLVRSGGRVVAARRLADSQRRWRSELPRES